VHAEQPDLAQLAGQLPGAGQLASLVPGGDVRHDLVGAEVAHGLPDGEFLLRQQCVDARRVTRIQPGLP